MSDTAFVPSIVTLHQQLRDLADVPAIVENLRGYPVLDFADLHQAADKMHALHRLVQHQATYLRHGGTIAPAPPLAAPQGGRAVHQPAALPIDAGTVAQAGAQAAAPARAVDRMGMRRVWNADAVDRAVAALNRG